VYYDALIEFANSDRRLLPGMTAYVSVPISAAYNVIRVRKEALRASPNISDAQRRELLRRNGIEPGKAVVWVAEGSTYRPVAITIGTTDYLYVEITSGAVKDGQQVLAGYRERES
jgi:multidrug efflux pump subunit AcrA (membrane-fusion protein)